eukprot:COSAG05_NODE_689_length_7904_cov_97.607816_6_plen_112_part_00
MPDLFKRLPQLCGAGATAQAVVDEDGAGFSSLDTCKYISDLRSQNFVVALYRNYHAVYGIQQPFKIDMSSVVTCGRGGTLKMLHHAPRLFKLRMVGKCVRATEIGTVVVQL